MTIILSRSGQDARRLEPQRIEREDFLQRYIYDNPDAIPLTEIREDLRLCILGREFPTGSGPIDVFAVDDEGILYLIETKLYKNPDKRRVLAQVLDYGASLWKDFGDPDDLIDALEDRIQKERSSTLAAHLASELDLDDEEADSLIGAIRERAGESGLRFVILMDLLDDRLKHLISFMNENSRFDVFAVDLDYYEQDELEIVIPRLYGAEVRKEVGSSGARATRRWDEETFFADAEQRLGAENVKPMREIYSWTVTRADAVRWGKGKKKGSASAEFERVSHRSLFTLWSNGDLQFNLKWLEDAPEGFAARLVAALGPSLRFADDATEAYPNFKIEEWGAKVSAIRRALSDVLGGEG